MAEKMDSERAPFESWVQTTSGWKACKQRGKPMHLRQNADGSYNDFRVNDRWCAWKARAHTAQPAHAVDVVAIKTLLELVEDEHGGGHTEADCRHCVAVNKLNRAIGNAQADVDPLVIRLGEVTTRLEAAEDDVLRWQGVAELSHGEMAERMGAAMKDAELWRYLVRENNKGGRGKFRIVWFDETSKGFATTDGVSVDGKDEGAIVRIIDGAMRDSAGEDGE